ncbi:hypothetical protein CcaverHIS002_0408490 [Cutaneotrichosporon cavernicola]|uniref:Isochorismatase-like domain-containing protein n=1 Tax=Cutaneotrichosporon cavernicola TaxID=279322 RepID=A0AA48L4Z3_9TREE|nr:uncharacterized protein CcaverHIS019_0408430 [Cutaneotrichosporon cavernicola]BEI84245.1 hypothetical protein CcaverHIS002_0408490 [Cutaneotrichosporon cavernicola]BEI92023.1 hypothetical protein CcaverHIS019_0408430 [Cutaneotrichosporon cavernicola]BEI99793.1 hypothetical protein CcaverHIS631_0408360 [Cutaneotrichosporon cavernicola]BEJ07569.1 hypothetical protein CcaverHIS641_0408380 [Cutaneotrichosporon cavernicola]
MTALIVIDMQRFFESPASPIMSNVNNLIAFFHSTNALVVYTQHGHTPAQLSGEEVSQLVRFWGAKHSIHRFSESWQLLPNLSPPIPTDITVQDKDTYDAFIHTHLEETLRARGVERVLVTGVLTNFCCETTARSAFNRGFETWVIGDACGANHPEMHASSLRALEAGFGEVVTTEEAIARLGAE